MRLLVFLFFGVLTSGQVLAEANPLLAKLPLCASCHGEQGKSINPQWPNLAGQHPRYLLKQLQDMRDSQIRTAPTMNALVNTLSPQEQKELAEYYAKMPVAHGTTPVEFLKRGEQLYRGGDSKKHITACIACHGPTGSGNNQAGFPVLSGQHAAYTILQLTAFKKGTRKNDLNQIMQDISQRMGEDDIEAVAHYIEGLH
ncbi:MAG: cytochrome c4 [Legionella sp. 40-6]|nr:cytochrome c4 [Legionella sp.]OJY40152.1 MAG: cytochrome c4 [Legionella sp. 40-6]